MIWDLQDAKQRIRPLFTPERCAASAWRFLDALLGSEPRKTGWMRAKAAGDDGPWPQQAIPGRERWDADALRDIVCGPVVEHLAAADAVFVVDETGFLGQGRASYGVGRRQHTGSAGKITNCQIAVFGAYVSAKGMRSPIANSTGPGLGRAIRRAWHPPMSPDDVAFATRPALAAAMIRRSITAGVPYASLDKGGCGPFRNYG